MAGKTPRGLTPVCLPPILSPHTNHESESESESDVVIDNGFRVTVTEVEDVGKLDHKGDPIYMYNLAVKVPLTNNFTYQDAHLRLSYNDGSSEELYIGDLSFIYVPENVTPGHLKKLR